MLFITILSQFHLLFIACGVHSNWTALKTENGCRQPYLSSVKGPAWVLFDIEMLERNQIWWSSNHYGCEHAIFRWNNPKRNPWKSREMEFFHQLLLLQFSPRSEKSFRQVFHFICSHWWEARKGCIVSHLQGNSLIISQRQKKGEKRKREIEWEKQEWMESFSNHLKQYDPAKQMNWENGLFLLIVITNLEISLKLYFQYLLLETFKGQVFSMAGAQYKSLNKMRKWFSLVSFRIAWLEARDINRHNQ